MIIIADYTLTCKDEEIFFVENTGSVPPCPHCGGTLCYRDSRKRICRLEGGKSIRLIIRRLRCEKCHFIHNELPDCVSPHKQYATDVISGVLDGIISSEDEDSEDYPCQETMRRWTRWFQENQNDMNGHLRRAGSAILGLGETALFSTASLLHVLRNTYQDWLERILRIVYNSGGFLAAIRR